ncbi:glycolate oxidase subunit GlcE [Chromohalobacter sp. HP20-39]|uniref:glycolate oxidase subunit GlcE n=1 Tax=Chromohalobacter sp. HP20-39 TaxID=3079306 RepID=UPI00294B51A6|nr:glycolate oxidase subunit GlcE [Chromohalobacter sp. HP20-39]MDV6317635.1 glycolate oxidase subunit GlcE [Chromohalobacter sp. HP20-39]
MTHPQDQHLAPAPGNLPVADHDDSDVLLERVRQAAQDNTPLRLVGGGSKGFYGRPVSGETLSLTAHTGIVHYDPVELVVTVRAGTRLEDLQAALALEGQQLAFEPPHFADTATVGGMVACGLSGPRRPWAGSVRDFVLGTRLITHDGKRLRFGGEVMKNVAGYDLSRLMVGAQGTLGVIDEVSFKVLPRPAASATLRLEMSRDTAMARLAEWGREPLPITGAAHDGDALHIRLEGGPSSVADTQARLGGEPDDADFWRRLREFELTFFSRRHDNRPLWRLSLPHRAPAVPLDGDELIDWAGAQRWWRSDTSAETIRRHAAHVGGHATHIDLDRAHGIEMPFTPLSPVLAKYHRRLKAELDPNGIFNPGRLYEGL